ncbi:PadR family transcriptional regulator [Chondrinema litorale]|uniref:PadR family transcriptional regulator n=1 Tax=Chondrinema litorale TaxID=2994555 RepID=UPI002543B7AE|nr:PadR family transcriptional regulator [Chondrinema litorale]UZR96245.1 PadR family transcriptional regulator [Chondrinema litorale]
MKGTYLGEFEEIVLLTVGVLYDEAYGLSIKNEVENRSNRSVNLSAIHAALYRLEEKGFLNSRLGEATGKRGGKRKKYFTVTKLGVSALEEAKSIRDSLWTSIPKIALQGGK